MADKTLVGTPDPENWRPLPITTNVVTTAAIWRIEPTATTTAAVGTITWITATNDLYLR